MLRRVGHDAVHRRAVLGAGAPAHHRRKPRGIERQLTIETRVGVGRATSSNMPVPCPSPRPCGAYRRPCREFEGRVIRADHADASAGLDRHVADGQSAFHRHGADSRSQHIRPHSPVAPPTPIVLDDRENHVLGGDRVGQRARRSKSASFAGFFSHTVCVATTWRSWLPPPIGTASAPHAPLVAVWESLQVISMPGCEMPNSGAITCAMPWSGWNQPTCGSRTPSRSRPSSRRRGGSPGWACRPGRDRD